MWTGGADDPRRPAGSLLRLWHVEIQLARSPAPLVRDLRAVPVLFLIHISEPTRPERISYAVFCLKKKKKS